MEYIEIKEQIKQKLPVARDLGDSENLLELGLSSLTIMRLVNQWRKQGVKVSFGSLMENPTLEGWWALIQRSMKKKAGKKRAQESKITPEKDMKQPFPLTDVQYAYWVGRDEEQALGGIDCHAYLEFDGGNIDPERLEKAWNVLQYHHPMLRACFLEDGTQKILDKPYCEKIKVHDFSRMSSEEAEAMAVSVRERLSHRKLKIEEGEVAGIELTLFPENRARMHVDMALLVADVQSLQILLRDLAAAYRGESLPAESKGWNFASYLERQKEEDKEERNNAEGYWKKRLEHLPKGPGLPLAKRPQEVTKTVFNRRIVRIGKEEWAHLQVRAKEYQTTPAMVLLTAYATVLERWSRNHRFLINIPSENVRTDDFRIIEKTAKDTVYIFFHTALGTTNCYRFVEKELRKEDLGDFLFINVEDVEWYYSIQYHELVDRITDEYVRKIEQLHYKNINLIGYCLGGILALNVAVKLLEKGIEVNNLFVIDSYPVSGKVEDQFIDEVIFLPNYQLMLSEVLEDVDDFKVMEFITEVRKRNNGNIPQNTFFNIIEKDTKMKNNSGLWEFVNSTKEKRFEAYAKAIEKKTCINVSAELLEATFEIYQHGFKGANVELPFYSGDICYLSACEEQKYFFADKNQNLEMWNDICLGEFEVINVPGNHVTCIHSEENATLLAQIIIERNIRG